MPKGHAWYTISELPSKEGCCLVFMSCLTPHDPMDLACQAPLSMGFYQARTLEWVAFPSLGTLPDPGIKLPSPALAGGFSTTESPGKPFKEGGSC